MKHKIRQRMKKQNMNNKIKDSMNRQIQNRLVNATNKR